MSRIVYKQRCKPPFDRETPVKNMRHIEYIATKSEAIKDVECGHALFGKLYNMEESSTIDDLKAVMNYVREKSKQKTNIYRSIISFSEADAKNMGYINNRKAWENIINRNISMIAEQMNIPISTLEWVASVHMKKGHPHVHLVYWDKEQGVKDYFVKPETVNKIRVKLIQDVFSEELETLFLSKNQTKKEIRQKGSEFFDDFSNHIDDMKSSTFLRYKRKLLTLDQAHNLSGISFTGFSAKRLCEMGAELYRIKSILPKQGSIKYGYLPKKVKKEIDRFSLNMLMSSKDLSSVFEQYVESEVNLAAMYVSKPEYLKKVKQKAYNEALKMIGNQVLKSIKKLNEKEWKARGDVYKQELTRQLMIEIFSLISSFTQQSEEKYLHLKAGGELSKQAKIELAKEMESKGLEWEG